MTFSVRVSHVVFLATGFGLAYFTTNAPPSGGPPVTQSRAHLERQLTSGSFAEPTGQLVGSELETVGTLDAVRVVDSAPPAHTGGKASRAKATGNAQKPVVSDGDKETPVHRALRTSVAVRVGPSYGAGVLVSDDGLVLTVNHVLEDGKPIRLSVAGLPWQEAKVVSRDILADLALLKVKLPNDGPQRAASLGSVTSCQPGDDIFTIGSPASMHFSLTRGVLSFVGRRFGSFRYIQTDLPIQPGNSGGPVFNEEGDVVGLMTFVLRNGQNLGFAIPVDYARAKFPELKNLARSGERMGFTAWAQAKVESPL